PGFSFESVPNLMSGTNPAHTTIERAAPVPGEQFYDPNFGTIVTCVTDADYIHSRHEYARFDPFNVDQTRIILDPDTRWRVYDTSALPYNRPENQVMVIDLEEPRWDPDDPDVIWGLYDFEIRTVNVATQQVSVVKDFAQDPVIGPLINSEPVFRITTREEGEPSTDMRYWVFFLQGDAAVDYVPRYIFTWDEQTDSVLGLYEVAANEVDIDYIGMSSLGNWIIIGGDDWNEGNLKGLTVADVELTQFWNVGLIGHQDVALTTDGREVLVGQNTATDHVDVIVLGQNPQSMPLIQLFYSDPSPFGMQSGIHVSCNTPGFCVISTYIEPGLPERNWLDRSIVLVKLNLNEPTGYYLAKVRGTTGAYYEETHASISDDGKKVVWATNWGANVGQEQVFMMQLDMPENWKQTLVNTDRSPTEAPQGYRLEQNAPNPFNPNTTIRYSVRDNGPLSISVYDMLGRELGILASGNHLAGEYEVDVDTGVLADGRGLSSGIYLYQLTARKHRETRKMVVLK
ncbi:MAG: T9SS type A sorting domain-containing protein, partial [Rhodothermales bacterium]|nr:T9SS type A sorting domain-containing protein [Rhodothermales bacterium]